MTSDYKLSIPLNFCWLKRWHVGVTIVVLINIFAPWGAYNSYLYSSDFDKKHTDPNAVMQAPWQTSCCYKVMDISQDQWMAFGLIVVSLVTTDVITWIIINDRFQLIEFRIKDCCSKGNGN